MVQLCYDQGNRTLGLAWLGSPQGEMRGSSESAHRLLRQHSRAGPTLG
jgi:hypothetical protein